MIIHLLEHDPLDFSNTNIDFWAKKCGHTVVRTYVCNGEALPRPDTFDWLMVMGGSPHAYDEISNPWLPAEKAFVAQTLKRGTPILGICFGAQVLAEALGGTLFRAEHPEIGWHEVRLTTEGKNSFLFQGVPETFESFHWHVDHFSLPTGCVRLAASEATPNQAFFSKTHPAVGIQFHPEYTLEIIEYFSREHSQAWVPSKYVKGKGPIMARTRTMKDTYWLMEAILENMSAQYRA